MTKQGDKHPAGADRDMVRGQQHTGNHDKPPPERGGSDIRGGTRAGAENVEPAKDSESNKTGDGGTDIDEKAQTESAKERRRQKGYV